MGSPVDNLSMNETIDIIDNSISNKKPISHIVVNAAKIVSMHQDDQLRESVVSADLINADGQAIVWASKILNKKLKERVAGIDLMQSLVKLSHKRSYKIFFFGATEEVVSTVVEKYSKIYSDDIIAGYRNGYFKKDEEIDIAQQISRSGADILFVAISSPTKENFLFENREILKNVGFTMGVGGSFDVVSGKVKRAPIWMQKSGLEWLYRVIQEPKRMWKRYLIGNTKFLWLLLRYKLGYNSLK